MDDLFEKVLEAAIQNMATDIHFRKTDNQVLVFYKSLCEYKQIELNEADKLFSFLQYQANLDVTSKKPQSGSFSHFYNDRFYDFRLSTVSSKRIKDGVLRILNCKEDFALEQLTEDKEVIDIFNILMTKKSGLIVFSGLTGQGKTTTVYTLLRHMNNKSVYSLEDPIEVELDDVIQLEINEKAGFGYDEGIKQVLRHNPDVLMIGEIRDETTAKMAVRAALTGVLVITTLHASSINSVIDRLTDLKVSHSDLLAVSLAFFNQTLVKTDRGYSCQYQYMLSHQIKEKLEGN